MKNKIAKSIIENKSSKAKEPEFSPDYDELKEMSLKESFMDGEFLDLLTIMSKPKYFDAINDILNTALKAAGVKMDGCCKNYAKLYCIHSLSYPVRSFCPKEYIQKIITKDILEMNNPGDEFHEMLVQFSCFSDFIDPDETGLLNVSDDRLKEFMTA